MNKLATALMKKLPLLKQQVEINKLTHLPTLKDKAPSLHVLMRLEMNQTMQ